MLFPYRDGDLSRLDIPFMGLSLPSDDVPLSESGEGRNRKVEDERTLASLFASRTSSNKHNLRSPTCAATPATLKVPLKGSDKSKTNVAVAEKTPTSSATKVLRREVEYSCVRTSDLH